MNRLAHRCVVLSLLASLPARAEWVERVEDGIMGTRIAVELWADDAAQGRAAIDAVLDGDASRRRRR